MSDTPADDNNNNNINNNSNNDSKNGGEKSSSSSSLWLPDVLWHHILAFSGPTDLCTMALVNKSFHSLANQDKFWDVHCQNRWKGKQGVSSFRGRFPTCKQSYAWAEYDKHREFIRRDEIVYFAWTLVYSGAESRMGLRRFQADGIYNSPYAGVCEWGLFQNKFCCLGMALPISRNKENWGWIIGKGYSTEYRSVEE